MKNQTQIKIAFISKFFDFGYCLHNIDAGDKDLPHLHGKLN